MVFFLLINALVAADYGRYDVCLFLLKHGAIPDKKSNEGHTAYDFALSKKYTSICQLLQSYSNTKPKPTKSLLEAVLANDLTNVELHTANQTNQIDIRDKDGKTPLYFAAQKGFYSIVVALVNAGANVNSQSTAGFYPLYVAGEHGHYTVCEYLMNNGANPNLKTTAGFVAL